MLPDIILECFTVSRYRYITDHFPNHGFVQDRQSKKLIVAYGRLRDRLDHRLGFLLYRGNYNLARMFYATVKAAQEKFVEEAEYIRKRDAECKVGDQQPAGNFQKQFKKVKEKNL